MSSPTSKLLLQNPLVIFYFSPQALVLQEVTIYSLKELDGVNELLVGEDEANLEPLDETVHSDTS